MWRLRAALACWVAVVLDAMHPAAARAGNADELPVGNLAAMVGGAVVATVDDSSAIYYNPAGLGAIDRASLDVSASAYSLRLYSARSFLSNPDGDGQDASVAEFVAVPTQIAYVRLLNEDLALGLGYFVPRSSDFLLRESAALAAAAGTSTYAIDLRVSGTEYLVAASLGTHVGKRFRWGIAAFGAYEKATENVVLFADVHDRSMATTELVSFSALTTGTAIGFELVAGAQLEVTERLTLGVSVRSARLRLYRSLNSATNTTIATESGPEPTLVSGRTEDDEPDKKPAFVQLGRYVAGFAYRFNSATLSVEGDVQPGLTLEAAGVERVFTWNARTGISVQLTDGLALGAGLFTDRSSEPVGGSLPSARVHFYGATMGLEIDNLHMLAAGEAADSLILSAVFAVRYAYGTGDTTTVSFAPDRNLDDALASVDTPVRIQELGLHVGSALHF